MRGFRLLIAFGVEFLLVMALAAGTRSGSFGILGPIGAGGMGEVYRARDTKLRRDVALKVLPDSFARDGERMARFEREAQILAFLNHPNIAHLYGLEGNTLVMELVEGESPKGPYRLMKPGSGAQIIGALEQAREQGIIHRDLKPANIRVTPEGVVKLLDFGLAKAFIGQTGRADSSAGSRRGIADYDPRRHRSRRRPGHRLLYGSRASQGKDRR